MQKEEQKNAIGTKKNAILTKLMEQNNKSMKIKKIYMAKNE